MATRVWYGGIAAVALLATAALVVFPGVRDRTPRDEADANIGIIVGLVTGCWWVLEISFNNFVDPRAATRSARFAVDNGAWGIIALSILIASSAQSLRTQRFASAIHIGLWSGLISGLIACLMGLLLVLGCMQCLLRDPLNIQEYAIRGTAEHATDMVTYFAYDTMAGALGHLLILGIAMGALLGAIGGLFTLLLGLVKRRSKPEDN